MIRKLFFQIAFLLFFGNIDAQQVPNFIAEDIQGESHNLYEYLNEGKVVIVDVFATWCTGCWTNHQQDKLVNLYKTYGPEGTNDLMVLFVEGDENTSNAALTTDNPFGDWTEDVPYPIFNPSIVDTIFTQAFASNGVPTTNIICPASGENIADIFDSDLAEIIQTIQECNSISNIVDLQIIGEREVSKPICINTDISFQVMNTGTEVVETFTVSASEISGAPISENTWQGQLLPGYSVPLDLGNFSLPSVLEHQVVNVLIETEDSVEFNNSQVIDYRQAPEVLNELTLNIKADFWVEEDNTRWWIENSANEVVSPINQLESLSESEASFFLENNDCFTFVIAEDFGDGMVLGEIRLMDDQGQVLYENANFGRRGEGSFEYLGSTVTSTSTLNGSEYQLDIYPSIVSSELTLQYQLDMDKATSLQIFSAHGQEMHSSIIEPIIPTAISIDVQDFPQGIYFVSMRNDRSVLTKKFIKQ